MDCLEFDRLLDNYVNLDTNEKFLLNSHAKSCEKCRKELEFYRSIVHAAESLPVIEPPADLLDKVNSRITNMPGRITMMDKAVNSFRIYSKQYATAAACLAVGLAVGLNSDMIRDKLFRRDAEGVISTSTSVADNDRGRLDDYEITDDEDMPEPEQDRADQVIADKGDNEKKAATEKSVNSQAPAVSAPPAATAAVPGVSRVVPKTSVSSSNTVVPKTSVSSPNTVVPKTAAPSAAAAKATAVPRVTVTSAPQLTTETPVATEASVITEAPTPESSKSRYTIARGDYHVPEALPAENKATEAPVVADTAIEGERYQIAMGSYEISEDEKKALAQNKLIVNESDITEIIECMNSSWIKGTTEGYTATSAAFANFLAKLDAAGIYYNYIQMSDTGSEVYFVLLAN